MPLLIIKLLELYFGLQTQVGLWTTDQTHLALGVALIAVTFSILLYDWKYYFISIDREQAILSC